MKSTYQEFYKAHYQEAKNAKTLSKIYKRCLIKVPYIKNLHKIFKKVPY